MGKLRNILFLFALVLALTACIKSGDLKIAKNSVPQQLDDGWAIATPQSVGLNTAPLDQALNMFFDENLFPTSKSLLIIKDNKLVIESYARDLADRGRLSNIRAVTKSISSLILGIGIDKGLVQDDLNLTVYSYLSHYFDTVQLKQDISLFHLLTMRSGLEWDNNIHTPELFNTGRFPSSIRLVVQKPMIYAPGTWFNLNDGGPQLISGIITDTLEISFSDFAAENLFSKIGITNFLWEKHSDGLNYGATGLYLTPRDMAKIGQLMAQNGSWNSVQVVPSWWINEATSVHLSEAYTLTEPYGFYWWIRPENNAFSAIGQGGAVYLCCPG